jgi:hypothetical protein
MKRPAQASQEYKRAVEIAEAITTADSNIVEAQYALADAYFGTGQLTQMLASEARSPLREKIQRWGEARMWYQRSGETWSRIHNPGARTPVGWACGDPKTVVEALDHCNAVLEKLKAEAKPELCRVLRWWHDLGVVVLADRPNEVRVIPPEAD